MNKNKIRKAAYKAISKERKGHQEFFDTFRKENKVKHEVLAEETAKIPSMGKMKETTTLRYIFVAIMVVILILRVLGVTVLAQEMGLGEGLMVLAILFAVGIPLIGIVAALTQRAHLYYPVGILMTIGIIRSFTNKNVELDETSLIAYIPMVIAIILAFYIPTKLKTTYTKSIKKEIEEGKEITYLTYTFDENQDFSDEILDSGI